MYLFKFTLFIALFHVSLAVKTQQLQQQCECAGSSTPIFGSGVPVFSPYDDNCKLDLSKIPPYAAYLENAQLNTVNILSTRTGGALLSLYEQKLVTKAWCDVKKSTGFPYTLMCQVPASNNYNDTLEMARYFKRSCCDIVAVGPPQDYPIGEIDELVTYLSGIAKACYSKPLVFAYPLYEDNSAYNPVKLFSSLCKAIENFGGLQTNLRDCLRVQGGNPYYPGKMIISDTSDDAVGANSFCLNGTNTILANVMPKTIVQIQQYTFSGNVDKADALQKEVNAFYNQALDFITEYSTGRGIYVSLALSEVWRGWLRMSLVWRSTCAAIPSTVPTALDLRAATYPDLVNVYNLRQLIQMERMLIKIIHGVDLGQISTPPFPKLTRDQVLKLYKVCQEAGVATTYPYDVDSYVDKDNDQNNKNKKYRGKYNAEIYEDEE